MTVPVQVINVWMIFASLKVLQMEVDCVCILRIFNVATGCPYELHLLKRLVILVDCAMIHTETHSIVSSASFMCTV